MKYTLVIAALLYSSSAIKITNFKEDSVDVADALGAEDADVQVKVSSESLQ